MVYCAVSGCKSRPDSLGKKLRYYSFPKDDQICKQWVTACAKRKPFKIDCARICSEHFMQSDFKLQDILLKVPDHKRRLRNGAVPSKCLPNEKRLSCKEKKRKKQENKALVEQCLAAYERKQSEIQNASGQKKLSMPQNVTITEAGLASYVSTFIAEEIPTYSTKRQKRQENNTAAEICPVTLQSPIYLSSGEPKKDLKYNASAEEGAVSYDLNSNRYMSDSDIYFAEKPLEEHSYSQIKYFTNGTTQTEFDYGCCKELHIMRLEAENRRLKAAIKKQVKRSQENETIRSSLRGIMTMGQINRLIHPGRQLQWKAEDIASAMSLHSAGPMAYALLRRKNFPLPSTSTLRGWAGKIEIRPGMLRSVLQLMNKLDYDAKEKLCVLCFNKIRLKAGYSSDKSKDMGVVRAKHAHVVMVRGLIKDWTQIIYYDLDKSMTASILKKIIAELKAINFVVTAVVSDMGPVITALWEELNISENQPFFLHPSDECSKIFFFVDVLHLIKLLRSRYIGTGFVLNGITIDTAPIKEILDLEKCELRISREHIYENKYGRQKVNLATQLLSHSVSAAIKRCILQGQMQSQNALECADFIKTVNDWFELFSSKYASNDAKERLKAFGLSLEVQNSILKSMSNKMRNLKGPKKQSVLRFQNGILLNNAALPQMLEYIKLSHNITFIITDRLNHAELERFFDIIRSKGGSEDHPTQLEFKYRLRSSLLGKMVL